MAVVASAVTGEVATGGNDSASIGGNSGDSSNTRRKGKREKLTKFMPFFRATRVYPDQFRLHWRTVVITVTAIIIILIVTVVITISGRPLGEIWSGTKKKRTNG